MEHIHAAGTEIGTAEGTQGTERARGAGEAAGGRQPHVELRHISKSFGGVRALTDINLTIERGSIHAFVGENGAGKSTLGKVIAGVIQPDHGALIIDGRQVRYNCPRDALTDGITIIAQEMVLVPQRTVLDNVLLGSELARYGVVDTRSQMEKFREASRRARFDLPPGAFVRDLSVADQQRVEILRALVRNAKLIVMDEPTAALSADEAEKLFHVVRALRDEGTTIIFVSHFLDEVLRLVDTVTVFKDGMLVRTSMASEETPITLVQAMTGRSVDTTFPSASPPPSDAPVVLSVTGLSRADVVRDVSFDIRAGEILGVAGLIGAGRTELARALFGIDRPDAGTIALNGENLRIRSPRDALEAGIAMIPESRKEQGLLMLRSVVENISLPHLGDVSLFGSIRRRLELDRARSLMDRVAVKAASPEIPVNTLSGGNQQKVLFAKWLFRRPVLLIADEPTRGVDVGAKRSIYELLVSLAAEGMAVLLISSELEEVLGLAHRVVVMRGGTIVARFNSLPVNEGDVMQAAFGATQTDGMEG